MLIGGIVKRVSGNTLDAALTESDIVGFLARVAESETAVFINLSSWIAGVFLLGVGGYLLSRVNDGTTSSIAGASYLIGSSVAIGSFVTWMALVRLAGSGVEPAVADALGFISSRADWLATVLVVGLGPLLLSLAGKDTWAPHWLQGLGLLAGAVSALTLIAMYAGGLSTYGAVIVPVGIVWTLGAALVAIRQANNG